MEEKKKSKNKNNLVLIAVILCLVALIAATLSVIFSRRETRTTEEPTGQSVGVLYCESTSPEDPFFVSPKVIRSSHEIKVTFRSGKIDKISYNYYGTFNNEGVADTAHSELHADYNKYLGTNEINQESLHPTFAFDGSKVKINLFAEMNTTLNAITAKLFFLNSTEFKEIANYSHDDLAKIYESKGFSCTFKE